MPPAALVSTTTWLPAAIAVRTPCTVALTGSPSYRWVRPRNISTRRSGVISDWTVPAWPATVGWVKPPSSATEISVVAAPRALVQAAAAGAQPDPSTTVTSYRSTPVSSRSRPALLTAAAYGSPSSTWPVLSDTQAFT